MSVSNFIITNAGLAAASTAGSGGPLIDITQFKLGSGVNYTPLPTHTGLNGTTLFTAAIASATPYNNDTMDIVLQIPAAAGPFDFGEIGLYMGSVLFAKCAYTSLQSKLSDAVNGVGSVWTIHALIKLADASALFNFTFSTITSIPIITGSAVTGPDTVSSTCNAILAMDKGPLSTTDIPILLARRNTAEWTPPGLTYIGSFTPDSFTTTTVTDPLFQSASLPRGDASMPNPNYRYLLIRRDTGQMVPITTVNSAGVATLSRAVSWLNNTSSFSVWDHQGSGHSQYLRGTTLCPTPGQDIDTQQIINADWYGNQKAVTTPLMNGSTAVIGDSLRWAAANHIHPTDTTRVAANNGTMSGLMRYDPANAGTYYEIGFRGTPLVINPPMKIDFTCNGKVIANIATSNGGLGFIQVSNLAITKESDTFAILNNCQNGTDSISIQTEGITMRWVGTSLTGTRTLGPRGMCTILRTGATEAWISGVGLS